jgi:hypothetical protein
MMSADDEVFIAGSQTASEIQQTIEAALGEQFVPSADPDPVPALGVGRTHAFFHTVRDFEDDTDLPLTQYQYWVSVHDTERDEQRQLAVAQRIFDAARAAGWKALLTHDLQGVIARHP